MICSTMQNRELPRSLAVRLAPSAPAASPLVRRATRDLSLRPVRPSTPATTSSSARARSAHARRGTLGRRRAVGVLGSRSCRGLASPGERRSLGDARSRSAVRSRRIDAGGYARDAYCRSASMTSEARGLSCAAGDAAEHAPHLSWSSSAPRHSLRIRIALSTSRRRRLTPRCSGQHPGVRPGSCR